MKDEPGTNISWIFDVEGEKGFRDREEQVLEDLANEDNVVIATGGGAVRERNRENLKIRGLVIYLNADLTLLVKRTKDETKRPLLKRERCKRSARKNIARERFVIQRS